MAVLQSFSGQLAEDAAKRRAMAENLNRYRVFQPG
jgi:hypothetical protein